jgi:hypothetical protein
MIRDLDIMKGQLLMVVRLDCRFLGRESVEYMKVRCVVCSGPLPVPKPAEKNLPARHELGSFPEIGIPPPHAIPFCLISRISRRGAYFGIRADALENPLCLSTVAFVVGKDALYEPRSASRRQDLINTGNMTDVISEA